MFAANLKLRLPFRAKNKNRHAENKTAPKLYGDAPFHQVAVSGRTAKNKNLHTEKRTDSKLHHDETRCCQTERVRHGEVLDRILFLVTVEKPLETAALAPVWNWYSIHIELYATRDILPIVHGEKCTQVVVYSIRDIRQNVSR